MSLTRRAVQVREPDDDSGVRGVLRVAALQRPRGEVGQYAAAALQARLARRRGTPSHLPHPGRGSESAAATTTIPRHADSG